MKLIFLGDALAEHLRRWSKSFTATGHEVHVITWNPRMLDGYDPVIVHQLKKLIAGTGAIARAVNLMRLGVEVRRLVSQIKPDLIHAQDAGAYAWMAMLSGFRPFMITPWGNDILITIHLRAADRFFTKCALRRADLVHAEGEDTKEVLLSLGADPQKIIVMPLGVDIEKFIQGHPPQEFIEKHGLAGVKVVVSTRTLNPIHDIETTIRAASLVLQKAPDVKFLIVSGGVETQSLQELAESLNLGRSLIFTGYVEEKELIACLQAADIYISTSLSDSGTPASTAEAMACGLPVISTDVGNIRSRVRNKEGGYVVPVKNPDIIAEKILHLLDDPTERERAGRLNRQHIEEQYDVRNVLRQMEVLYSMLVSRSNAMGAR